MNNAAYEIEYVLRRRVWLQTEFPAVLVWGGLAVGTLLPIVLLMMWTLWWGALLLPWLLTTGRKGVGILLFLLIGRERLRLRIEEDGTIFVSTNGGEFEYAHWRGFCNFGNSFLLWGADGRYRLIIPRNALTPADFEAIRTGTGVELLALGPNDEARIKVSNPCDEDL